MYLKYDKRLLSKDEPFIFACSGGPDSMACLHFLTKGKHSQHGMVVFIHHGTVTSDASEKIVRDYCQAHSWQFKSLAINLDRPMASSQEEYWRDERYRLFGQVAASFSACKIITAHHLDDAVETYLFNTLNGKVYTMPVSRRLKEDSNVFVVRPFIRNKKESLLMYCKENNLCYYNDPTNHDGSNMRSYIRKNIVPQALFVNAGLYTVVEKILYPPNKKVLFEYI
ncbi:MAG: tRNA lysidine(34) synthetase TilS [Alphaproteobacteria bacterium]|nr:tRNA lysidine(34) synthetase TilS [Alphaproteobacteria bacterium]